MKLLDRIYALIRRSKLDREMDDELAFHIEEQTKRNVASGMSLHEAVRAARRQFGWRDRIREEAREAKGLLFLDHLACDLRYGIRMLRKSPGFTLVVVATLALGIGANTAIFSFFNGILLQPLPFDEPDNLVLVEQHRDQSGTVPFSPADFADLRAQTQSLAGATAYWSDVATLSGRGAPESVFCSIVSDGFFDVLGSTPRLGRAFSARHADSDTARQVVVSDRFWRQHLEAREQAPGETIVLNGVSYTVVGVMAPDFEFPRWVDAWVCQAGSVPEFRIGGQSDGTDRNSIYLSAVGRLAQGFTAKQAEIELTAILKRLPEGSITQSEGRSIRLSAIREQAVGGVRHALAMLLGFVGLVLVIACLNVANLVLSRSTVRQREISVRMALGASRSQIARQLLTENVLLSLLGGAAGIAVGNWGAGLLVGIAPADIPRLSEVQLDTSVLLFSLGLSIATGLFFGMAPVLQTADPDLARNMGDGARGVSGGSRRQRMRGVLVAAEVALSLVLLLSAGLLVRSFWKMLSVPPGYNPEHLVSARITLTGPDYDTADEGRNACRSILERLQSLPGVTSAAASFDLVTQSWDLGKFAVQGRSYAAQQDRPDGAFHRVTPDFFRTMGVSVLQGRVFEATDDANAAPVAIVNAALARRFFGEDSAIGQQIQTGYERDAQTFSTIVGVVANVKHDGPEAGNGNHIYIPFIQAPLPSFFVLVRSELDAPTIGAAMKRAVGSFDPNLPVAGLTSMEDAWGFFATKRRFPLVLVSLFAGLALLLSTVGIFAVTAHAVAQRTREIGIRMALGAQTGAVLRLVMQQGLRFVVTGLGAGLVIGTLAALLLRSLLFEVQPLDPVTFVAIPLLLGLVAVLACWIPSRRATKVDPMIALRAE